MYSHHLWLGHEQLDRQHDQLANAVARFSRSTTHRAMTIAMNDFFEIWREHTRFEEQLMMRSDYPLLHLHQKSHYLITRELSQMFMRLLDTGLIDKEKISNRMRYWFDDHFHEYDVSLAQHLESERLLLT